MADFRLLAEKVPQWVDALQQAESRERLDLEFRLAAARQSNGATAQVDLDLGSRRMQQFPVRGLVYYHGQQAVTQGVGAEDIGDTGADHGADAEVQQRPGRMLPR